MTRVGALINVKLTHWKLFWHDLTTPIDIDQTLLDMKIRKIRNRKSWEEKGNLTNQPEKKP